MVLGADGAYYADIQSAIAGAKASAKGVFASEPDDQNAIFGGGSLIGSGIMQNLSGGGVSLDLGSTFQDSTGTPNVIPQSSKGSLGAAAVFNTVLHPLDTIKGFFDPAQAAKNAGMDNAAGASLDSGKAALAFITDIPRVATTALGLILIIAGIFALTKGPAVNIVTGAVRNAVTS